MTIPTLEFAKDVRGFGGQYAEGDTIPPDVVASGGRSVAKFLKVGYFRVAMRPEEDATLDAPLPVLRYCDATIEWDGALSLEDKLLYEREQGRLARPVELRGQLIPSKYAGDTDRLVQNLERGAMEVVLWPEAV